MFNENEIVVLGELDTNNVGSMEKALEKVEFVCPFFYFSEDNLIDEKLSGDGQVSCHCYLREDNYYDGNCNNIYYKEVYENRCYEGRPIGRNIEPDQSIQMERLNRGIEFINRKCLSKEGCRECPFIKDFLKKTGLEGLVIPAEEGEKEITEIVKAKWEKNAPSALFKKGNNEVNIKLLNAYVYMLSKYRPLYCEKRYRGFEKYLVISNTNKGKKNKKWFIENFIKLVEKNIAKKEEKKSK